MKSDFSNIIGVDEVGRGCLAGPVVSSAVVLTHKLPQEIFNLLTDSKKITATTREKLAAAIRDTCYVGLGLASVEEIDQINILQASLLSMKRAVEDLLSQYQIKKPVVWVDGNKKIPKLNLDQSTFIKGDLNQKPISAASIVAKVFRDNLMKEYALQYPDYHFEKHKGYGSVTHKKAIAEFGILQIHRKTFSPIKELV